MPIRYILFAFSTFLEKANSCFLPCPFKFLTGHDCPGCGFQRAFLALLKGNLQESIHLYPPAIPLLLTIAISLLSDLFWREKSKSLLSILFIITGSIILISYTFKVLSPQFTLSPLF